MQSWNFEGETRRYPEAGTSNYTISAGVTFEWIRSVLDVLNERHWVLEYKENNKNHDTRRRVLLGKSQSIQRSQLSTGGKPAPLALAVIGSVNAFAKR